MNVCARFGLCLLLVGCYTPDQDERRSVSYAQGGVANRYGCPNDFARVTNDAVDVCVALYEAPGFGAPPAPYALEQANDLCAQTGARLCSEAEWVAACRGPVGSLYPYGDTFDPYACVTEAEAPLASGMRNRCRSGFGIYDMSGNAAEWVQGGLLKGGAFDADSFSARCGARETPGQALAPTAALTGVRCCREPQR